MNKPQTYTCECCEGVFEKGWTDEEAKQEASENFPDLDEEHSAIVCDDCYNKMMGIEK